ncbi:hypothetical protein EF72_21415 [Salmonella enterica]|nr:hypothetical protein [Salmonella enterica]
MKGSDADWIGKAEVMELLGLSNSFVDGLMRRKELPRTVRLDGLNHRGWPRSIFNDWHTSWGNLCGEELKAARRKVKPPPVPRRELAGLVINYWTVLQFAFVANGQNYWFCRCRCGTHRAVIATGLMRGESKSCGCRPRKDLRVGPHLSEHELYDVWKGMRQRCANTNHPSFKHYGGRGIRVCRRWARSFRAFLVDMGARPKGYSIERIDVNGNYCPENCCWADAYTQSMNRRNSRRVRSDG